MHRGAQRGDRMSDTARADALIPGTHPFRHHLQRVAAAGPHRPWTPADPPLPALYISHGAPPTFEDEPWMRQLHDWARSMPRPAAILIVSAHWESAPLAFSGSAAGTGLVYD